MAYITTGQITTVLDKGKVAISDEVELTIYPVKEPRKGTVLQIEGRTVLSNTKGTVVKIAEWNKETDLVYIRIPK